MCACSLWYVLTWQAAQCLMCLCIGQSPQAQQPSCTTLGLGQQLLHRAHNKLGPTRKQAQQQCGTHTSVAEGACTLKGSYMCSACAEAK